MIEPLFARVLLERETLKSSSIIIPQTAEKRNAPEIGVVVAVGPHADHSIELGQKVIFGRHAGDWIKYKDKEFYVVADEDIIGIVK